MVTKEALATEWAAGRYSCARCDHCLYSSVGPFPHSCPNAKPPLPHILRARAVCAEPPPHSPLSHYPRTRVRMHVHTAEGARACLHTHTNAQTMRQVGGLKPCVAL